MSVLNGFKASDFTGPDSAMTGLPNVAYVSEEFAAFERDAVLARTWTCIGNASHLQKNGWVQPVDLLGLPLLIVRDRDGTVRVFHNVCSHRGMRLVDQAGPSNGIVTCRYHGWCYRLDGGLHATPHVAGEGLHEEPRLDIANIGLKPVCAALFHDLIFVNVSGDAPAFDDFIAPVKERWHMFDFGRFRHGGEDSRWFLDLNCNWKLAQENHVDGYHLPFIHPDLNRYSPLRDHRPLLIEGSASGQISLGQKHGDSIGDEVLPKDPHLDEKWQNSYAEFLSIFPNVMMGVHADHVWTVFVLPQAAGRCHECMDLYYFEDGATSPVYAEQRRNNRDRMLNIFEEDRMAVEGMQQGRRSPAFSGGVFSPEMDQPAHCFNRWAAGAVQNALQAAT